MDLINEAKNIFEAEIHSLQLAKECINKDFSRLVELILNCKGKIFITGMGKAGYVGKKISATMSSLGTAAFFLHPSEALHGDLGRVQCGDLIMIFSKSGETDEILELIPSLKSIGVTVVGITFSENSSLKKKSDHHIYLKMEEEISLYKMAPTTSTTIMMVFGDALAVILEKLNKFELNEFALYHPKGTLGKKMLLRVQDLIKQDNIELKIYRESSLKDIILALSSSGCGAINVIDKKRNLIGLITDGDLRRFLEKTDLNSLSNICANDIMTKKPITLNATTKAVEALRVMGNRDKKLSVIPVVDDYNKSIGILRLHDLLDAGIS